MIAYRVVAVPERAARAAALAAAIGGQVILDERHAGPFANHLRALESAGAATHVVVLEDDAIVCGDFVDHVERLIRERPDHLLGLYVGRRFPKAPQPTLANIIPGSPAWLDHPGVTDRLRWAVGYVMPVVDIPVVMRNLAGGSRHAWINTDMRIGRWHAACGRLSYPFPSPVDHDDEIPSTSSRNRAGRVAWQHCQGRAS